VQEECKEKRVRSGGKENGVRRRGKNQEGDERRLRKRR